MCAQSSNDAKQAGPPGVAKKGDPRCLTSPWRGSVARLVAGLGVLLALTLLLGWTGLYQNYDRASSVATLVAGMLAGSLGAYLYLGRHVKRLRRRVIEHDRRVCLRCGYALKGLPDKHDCPECGTRYDIKATRDVWAAWLERNVDMDDLKTLTKSPPSSAGR